MASNMHNSESIDTYAYYIQTKDSPWLPLSTWNMEPHLIQQLGKKSKSKITLTCDVNTFRLKLTCNDIPDWVAYIKIRTNISQSSKKFLQFTDPCVNRKKPVVYGLGFDNEEAAKNCLRIIDKMKIYLENLKSATKRERHMQNEQNHQVLVKREILQEKTESSHNKNKNVQNNNLPYSNLQTHTNSESNSEGNASQNLQNKCENFQTTTTNTNNEYANRESLVKEQLNKTAPAKLKTTESRHDDNDSLITQMQLNHSESSKSTHDDITAMIDKSNHNIIEQNIDNNTNLSNRVENNGLENNAKVMQNNNNNSQNNNQLFENMFQKHYDQENIQNAEQYQRENDKLSKMIEEKSSVIDQLKFEKTTLEKKYKESQEQINNYKQEISENHKQAEISNQRHFSIIQENGNLLNIEKEKYKTLEEKHLILQKLYDEEVPNLKQKSAKFYKAMNVLSENFQNELKKYSSGDRNISGNAGNVSSLNFTGNGDNYFNEKLKTGIKNHYELPNSINKKENLMNE